MSIKPPDSRPHHDRDHGTEEDVPPPRYRMVGNIADTNPDADTTTSTGDFEVARIPSADRRSWALRPGPPGQPTEGEIPRPRGSARPAIPRGSRRETAPRPADHDLHCGRCARRRRRHRIYRRLVAGLIVLCILQVGAMWSLNTIDPPFSRFMSTADGAGAAVVQQDTDIEYVSRNFLVLVMGQEDQLLPTRSNALDWNDFVDRAQAHLRGQEDTSGSTIPQQLAKNLFLTGEQSAVRKGQEALLAEELAFLLSDARILELYINLAQFGPSVWGVCAGSWYWFGHSPREMTLEEAAQMVGLLPAPSHVHRGPDGGMAFDGEASPVSSHTVTWALAHAQAWFDQMGAYAATESIGVPGLAEDTNPDEDPCRTMPDEVAQLIAHENGQ